MNALPLTPRNHSLLERYISRLPEHHEVCRLTMLQHEIEMEIMAAFSRGELDIAKLMELHSELHDAVDSLFDTVARGGGQLQVLKILNTYDKQFQL